MQTRLSTIPAPGGPHPANQALQQGRDSEPRPTFPSTVAPGAPQLTLTWP